MLIVQKIYVPLYRQTLNTFGIMKSRIKDLLKERSMTLCDLAEKIGTTQTSVSRMLSENGNPTYDTLIRIADAMGVEIQDLFTDDRNLIVCPKCGARFKLEE